MELVGRVALETGVRCAGAPPGTAPVSSGSSLVKQWPRRILALCLGGIGDTVLAFAALRDLRCARPDDHITALAMWPQSAELLEDLGIFNEVLQHNFHRDRWWRSLRETMRLRMSGYDASLLTFPTNRFEYNALSCAIGATRRFGHTYVRGGDLANMRFLLTDRISQQLGHHVIDENRALVAHLTNQSEDEPADIRLGPLDPSYHARAARILGHLNEPLLGIHAGCSTYKGHAARRWPVERFGELCRLAHRLFGLQPVVFGGSEEHPLKVQIQEVCPDVFFAHGESIRHTAALIARCAVFASNDSGLAHIAAALDVPVAMACGATDARGIGPYPGHGQAVEADVSCSPCFQVGRRPLCCTHTTPSACMKRITVAQMLSAIRSVVRLPGDVHRCDQVIVLHSSLSYFESNVPPVPQATSTIQGESS